MLNNCSFAGRIANDLVIRKSKNGKSFIYFDLAIPRKYDRDKTDFIDCVVWGKEAENLEKYQAKGNFIIVAGSIETYIDESKNKRYQCVVATVSYTEKKKENTENNEEKENTNNNNEKIENVNPFANAPVNNNDSTDDELPF